MSLHDDITHISRPESRPTLKPGQIISIDIHDDSVLWNAVESKALLAGWGWYDSGKQHIARGSRVIQLHPDKTMVHAIGYHPDSLMLDARTDMGLLIDLLASTPATPVRFKVGDWVVRLPEHHLTNMPANSIHKVLDTNEYDNLRLGTEHGDWWGSRFFRVATAEEIERATAPKPPVVNGYPAQYHGGAGYVSFGCARISCALLRAALELMGPNVRRTHDNRSVDYIALDSGVKLTAYDIERIIKYVNEVNKP